MDRFRLGVHYRHYKFVGASKVVLCFGKLLIENESQIWQAANHIGQLHVNAHRMDGRAMISVSFSTLGRHTVGRRRPICRQGVSAF